MTEQTDQTKPLILVVDDEDSSRLLQRATLEQAGYRVIEAEDGRAALRCFDQERPDAVLLDVMMPHMDGFDCCRALRGKPQGEHIPVLMMTGLDDVDAIHRAFDAGATDFVSKPINWTVLGYRVKYMLRARDAFHEVIDQQKRIEELAFFDHLTGLANRALFISNLDAELAENADNESLLGLLFLDLDRFKNINDTLGHHIGDLLLKGVADRIGSCIRETDQFSRMPGRTTRNYVARLGGDEFTLLLPGLQTPENAGQVAHRINRMLTEPFMLKGIEVFITASIGIALAPVDSEETDDLMQHADLAMYHAKEMGKDRFQYYQQELNLKAGKRLELENDIRKALPEEEFELFFQPQIDMSSGRIIGAEALARWHHDQRGWVSPGEFIPLIEELSLMVPFTDWVIRSASRHQAQWIKQRVSIPRIAINISSKNFVEQDIPTRVKASIEEHGLHPDWLELEMTESVLALQNRATIDTLHQIRELGMKISVDDFGTGYSSLAYLKVFPVDIIKIDRFFIKDLLTRSQDNAIIRAIIAMAKELGIKLIAEGIEEPEQYHLLRRMGADYGQGFLFSKAVCAEDFARMLAQGRDFTPEPV